MQTDDDDRRHTHNIMRPQNFCGHLKSLHNIAISKTIANDPDCIKKQNIKQGQTNDQHIPGFEMVWEMLVLTCKNPV